MKFRCGPTPEERADMAWEASAARLCLLETWRPWFCLRPVRLGSNDCRWLEYFIGRRGEIVATKLKVVSLAK